MLRLLKSTMRGRPDRIIVGEVRAGAEALALLKAWNTGHPGGVATVHANDARAGLIRLAQLMAEVTQAPMHALIAEAISLVVSIVKDTRHRAGRRIEEIVSVEGVDSARLRLFQSGVSRCFPFPFLFPFPLPWSKESGALPPLAGAARPCGVLRRHARRYFPTQRQASTSGGGLEWESPLQKFGDSIKGPVAFVISLMGIVVCGAMLIWGGEINEFVRRFVMVILVISLLVFASSILTSLFGIGAIIDLPQVPLSGEAVQGNAPQGRSSYE
jgi:type IV secretory pathway VirB2 component (pilin)